MSFKPDLYIVDANVETINEKATNMDTTSPVYVLKVVLYLSISRCM